MEYQFVSGDTGSRLRVSCKDAATGAAFNLTAMTVKLRWRANDDALVGPKTMSVIAPATNGVAEYQFLASELKAGIMTFEVEIVDGSSRTVKSLSAFGVRVRAALA